MAVAFFFRKGARGYGFCLGAQDLGGKNIAEGGGELWKLKDKARVESHFWNDMLRGKEHLGKFTKG